MYPTIFLYAESTAFEFATHRKIRGLILIPTVLCRISVLSAGSRVNAGSG